MFVKKYVPVVYS